MSRGATIVIASHEHDRALSLAVRTVTLAGGVVTATGSPFPLKASVHVA